MRVSLSVPGKFHFFHLARQFYRRGWLDVIFSTYPRFKLRNEDLPPEKILTKAWLTTILLAKNRYGMSHDQIDRQIQHMVRVAYHRFVAKHLPPCDVFISLSGSGLRGGRLTQSRGGKYICERSSSHIQWADACLRDEYARWGQTWFGVDPRYVDTELAEYEISDRIVVPSGFVERTFLDMGVDKNKLRRLPFGVELRDFHKVDSPPADEFIVVFVGAVSFRKGIPYLIDAFNRFRHPRKKLLIIGKAQRSTRDYLRGANLERIEFLDRVPHQELQAMLSRSHVLVLPSVEEGLAKVQAEAMACGCPVIASENTGAQDLFMDGKEGFIVPVRDPAAIQQKLELLADDADLHQRMSRSARARVEFLGGWDTYGDGYAALCEELVGPADSYKTSAARAPNTPI